MIADMLTVLWSSASVRKRATNAFVGWNATKIGVGSSQ